jgi:hypothetical protein
MPIPNLILITVENAGTSLFGNLAPLEFPLHLPAATLAENLLSMLSALTPGHVLQAGEPRMRDQTFLAHLARRAFSIAARVPEPLSAYLPERSRDADPRTIAALSGPSLVWIHTADELPEHLTSPLRSLATTARLAVVAVPADAPVGSGTRWGAARFSFPIETAGCLSLLDVFPTLAQSATHSLPVGDGLDLSKESSPRDRFFFAEDWRRGLVSVTEGADTLVARLGRRGFPFFLERLRWRLRGARGRAGADPSRLIECASRLRPVPVDAAGPGGRRLEAGRRRALLRALEDLLAVYARSHDEEVLDRLRDLGYL